MASLHTTTKMPQADFLFCEHVLEEFKRPKHLIVPSHVLQAKETSSTRSTIQSSSQLLVKAFKLVSEPDEVAIHDDHKSFLGLVLDLVTDVSDGYL